MTAPRRPALGRFVVAAALLLVSCASGEQGPGGSVASSAAAGEGEGAESPEPSAGASAAVATPGAGEFVNPVVNRSFADPFVLRVDDTYYAYGTGFVLSTSSDLVEWTTPSLVRVQSNWALSDWWAPEVAQTSAGFVFYYTGRSQLPTSGDLPAQCIGRAVSSEPDGEFVDDLPEPLVCQPDLGGSIDASPFVDADGMRYLLWKNDGNCCGRPVDLWMAPLTPDGLALAGEPVALGVTNDRLWEGGLIEAPTLWFQDGTYYLFFSANAYYNSSYAVGYATSSTVTGPYTDAEENPILHGDFDDLMADPQLQAAGPGHQSIIADPDGDLWMVYHAWDRDAVGPDVGGQRTMWIDELVFEDGKPVVLGPDSEPQPAPSAN